MLYLKRLFCLPLSAEELLPRSRNLAMKSLLALSEKDKGGAPNAVRDSMPELPEEISAASR